MGKKYHTNDDRATVPHAEIPINNSTTAILERKFSFHLA